MSKKQLNILLASLIGAGLFAAYQATRISPPAPTAISKQAVVAAAGWDAPLFWMGPGDINGDGVYDSEDAQWLKWAYMEGCSGKPDEWTCCRDDDAYCRTWYFDSSKGAYRIRGPQDVTGDGALTYTDVLYEQHCLRYPCHNWYDPGVKVSGRVTDKLGQGISGVTISVSEGDSGG